MSTRFVQGRGNELSTNASLWRRRTVRGIASPIDRVVALAVFAAGETMAVLV
jgi:hypothetical protein